MTTKLRYLWDATETSCETTITDISNINENLSLVLNETPFHAQGGGQPTDKGSIIGPHGNMQVEMVKINDQGEAIHQGIITGSFNPGDHVTCQINIPWRDQMTKLHSAGHILRFAMLDIGIQWKPTRGFHFPIGTYIESKPDLVEEVTDASIQSIKNAANEHLQKDYQTKIEWEGETRIVHFGPHAMACGGTHISQGSDIKKITITKVKKKSGNVRLSYSVE